jgi:protein gp37
VTKVATGANGRLGPEHASTPDWVIVGGERGPDHRPVDPDWVRRLRDQALAAEVAFFFKQWGGPTPGAGGQLLDGRTWDQYPRRHAGDATGPGQGSR